MSGSSPDGVADMPAAEVEVTDDLVRQLLADQHPDLAELPLTELANGWDNVIYRLGQDLTVRLPRREVAAILVEHEQRWLPVLGPRLPLDVPVPVRVGSPTGYYPWSWSVLPWFPGASAWSTPPDDPVAAATALGRFLAALHRPAPADYPPNPYRGCPLADRDEVMRARVASLSGVVDQEAVLRRWDDAVALPPWAGPPLWLHGDLHPHNVVVDQGRIRAVIDFGDITAGDPATDLAVGFTMFDGTARKAFREAADTPERPIDDAMWGRAAGWALSVGVAILANSADNPTMAALGRRMVGLDQTGAR